MKTALSVSQILSNNEALSDEKQDDVRLLLPNMDRLCRSNKLEPKRSLQIADQISRELAYMIDHELRDPRIKWVTVQLVEVSSDYTHAKVYVTTLMDSAQRVILALNTAAGYLRKLLYKKLTIHTVPNLRFFYDETALYAKKIDKLLAAAKILSVIE